MRYRLDTKVSDGTLIKRVKAAASLGMVTVTQDAELTTAVASFGTEAETRSAARIIKAAVAGTSCKVEPYTYSRPGLW